MKLTGKFIKHESFKDVFFEVTEVVRSMEEVIFSGFWHNSGFVRSYSLGKTDTIHIPSEEMKRWMYCTEPNVECVRYAKWVYCD